MINPEHGLSLTRQAELLQLSRASLYYEPVGTSQADLKLMRRIDELHLGWPFLGSRMLRNMLRLEGITIGRKHVATLMRKMGIEAIYRRANTSRRWKRRSPSSGGKASRISLSRPPAGWPSPFMLCPKRAVSTAR